MSQADIIGLIREFGFPTVVVLWFMFRLEKKLDRQAEIQSSQLQATALLAKSIDYLTTQHREVSQRMTMPLPLLPAPEEQPCK